MHLDSPKAIERAWHPDKPSHWKCIFACFALLVLIAGVYGKVCNYGFVGLDDELYAMDNRHVQTGWSKEGIRWAMATSHTGNWHPVTWMSLMTDVQLFGFSPASFHGSNLLLHAVNSMLIFLLFVKFTNNLWPALFLATLFAIHPLHVEPVAWISSRKDLLSLLFGLLALAAYRQYTRSEKLTAYLLMILWFVLSLASKPMLVTFPFVLLLLDHWPFRRFDWRAVSAVALWRNKQLRQVLFEKVPLLLISILFSVTAYIAQSREGAVASLESVSWIVRLSNVASSYFMYIYKTLWPFELSVFYPRPVDAFSTQSVLLGVVTLSGLVYCALRTWKRHPYVFVGTLWFLGTLVPVIGFVQIGAQTMADRYTYFPQIGLLLGVIWVGWEIVRRHRYGLIAYIAVGTIFSLGCAAISFAQLEHWRSEQQLYEHVIDIYPNHRRARINLAFVMMQDNDLESARDHLQVVLSNQPNDAETWSRMAALNYRAGRLDEAKKCYEKALQIRPDLENARMNKATIFAETGDSSQALRLWQQILDRQPNNVHVLYNMALWNHQQGKVTEAKRLLKKILALDSTHSDSYLLLANILQSQGNTRHAQQLRIMAESLRKLQ